MRFGHWTRVVTYTVDISFFFLPGQNFYFLELILRTRWELPSCTRKSYILPEHFEHAGSPYPEPPPARDPARGGVSLTAAAVLLFAATISSVINNLCASLTANATYDPLSMLAFVLYHLQRLGLLALHFLQDHVEDVAQVHRPVGCCGFPVSISIVTTC